MNFDTVKFRCSSISYLMTDPKSKAAKEAGELSETAKTHCVDVYVSAKYGRQTDISNRYVEKGLMVEEDGITLFSRINKTFYKKNKDLVQNPFLKGTPDLYTGKDILAAETIIDIKCSWDLFTFSRVRAKEVNDNYWWQLQGYMALTGAKSATLAYCLINTPEVLINDEKRKLLWKMGVVSEENESYQEACEELERSMIFDDIPMHERLIEFKIERDDVAIELMYERVKRARNFLQAFDLGVSINRKTEEVNA